MSLLHPYFLIPAILLLYLSFMEVYGNKKPSLKYLYYFGAWFSIVAGLRYYVGADYGAYKGIYLFYSNDFPYSEILKKSIYMDSNVYMEWLYVLINKILLDVFKAPFHILTFLIAIITIFTNYNYIKENSFYPYTYIILLMFPNFFIGECGQIRQNMGGALGYYAIRYIKERNLPMFLLFIHLAGGIHNVCYLLLPMYWLVKIPLNKFIMALLFTTSVILSPFHIYNYFGSFLDSIMPNSDAVNTFNGYMSDTVERINGGFGLPEFTISIFVIILFTFDTQMKEKLPYYEYFRNYSVIGVCFYFIFRDNPIYSSRLTGIFIAASGMVIVNALYVANTQIKKFLYAYLVFSILFNFVIFSSFKNITKGNFTFDRYRNVLLP